LAGMRKDKFAARDFAAQVRQALLNIVEILGQAQAKPEHIARMTWYVLDKGEYMAAAKEMGAAYREIIGRHYPAHDGGWKCQVCLKRCARGD